MEARMPEFIALCVKEAGKSLSASVAEVREAVDFLRYYAHAGAQAVRPAGKAAGPDRRIERAVAARPRRVRLHQPVEFPAGHLHRPGRRCAGRRQHRDRQAGRADHADCLRRRHSCCMRPACRRTCCSSLPGDGATRGRGADQRPARGRRGLHRLHRDRLGDQPLAGRAQRPRSRVLIAETGGQNALIADSSALPEQLVKDAMTVGLRFRRPALLGGARAVRAGRHRRQGHPHAGGRDGRTGRRRPGAAVHRRRPGDRRGRPAHAGRPRRAHGPRGQADQGGAPADGGAARQLLRAARLRAEIAVAARRAKCSARCCT